MIPVQQKKRFSGLLSGSKWHNVLLFMTHFRIQKSSLAAATAESPNTIFSKSFCGIFFSIQIPMAAPRSSRGIMARSARMDSGVIRPSEIKMGTLVQFSSRKYQAAVPMYSFFSKRMAIR